MLLALAANMGINESCSYKSIVSCEDRNKLNRTAYGGSSQATFFLYLVISIVADMVIIRRRDAKRWKNDYLVKGVSLPPLAYSGVEALAMLPLPEAWIEIKMLSIYSSADSSTSRQ